MTFPNFSSQTRLSTSLVPQRLIDQLQPSKDGSKPVVPSFHECFTPPRDERNPSSAPLTSATQLSTGRTSESLRQHLMGTSKPVTMPSDLSGDDGANTLTGSGAAEQLRGLGGNDRLFGLAGDDRLDGGRGKDRLNGGLGDDRLDGGLGRDLLTGGSGADRFCFAVGRSFGNNLADRITDFRASEGDRIEISRQAFGLPSGAVVSLQTVNSDAELNRALGTASLLVQDLRDGSILFNQNGTATGAGQGGVFAVVNSGLTLQAGDFTLVA